MLTYASCSAGPALRPKCRPNVGAVPARRDGLERIQVPDDATVAQLKTEIHRVLAIPTQDMALSKDAKLVRFCFECNVRAPAP